MQADSLPAEQPEKPIEESTHGKKNFFSNYYLLISSLEEEDVRNYSGASINNEGEGCKLLS